MPLTLTAPVSTQHGRCTSVVQGKLEESDLRIRETNAPFDMHRFNASAGTELFFEGNHSYFNSGVALFHITGNGNTYTMIDSDQTGTNWQLFPVWIYEDGEYTIRISSIKYDYPFGQAPDRMFGYYTIQMSPVAYS